MPELAPQSKTVMQFLRARTTGIFTLHFCHFINAHSSRPVGISVAALRRPIKGIAITLDFPFRLQGGRFDPVQCFVLFGAGLDFERKCFIGGELELVLSKVVTAHTLRPKSH